MKDINFLKVKLTVSHTERQYRVLCGLCMPWWITRAALMFWKGGRCCDLAKGNSAFVFEEIILCLLQIFVSPYINLF